MVDPSSKKGAVSSIQLRLRKGADLNAARDNLRAVFPMEMAVQVSTWRDLQGPLLAAVQMETTILNILLFLIIAVAGFGILATFFMIVVERRRKTSASSSHLVHQAKALPRSFWATVSCWAWSALGLAESWDCCS